MKISTTNCVFCNKIDEELGDDDIIRLHGLDVVSFKPLNPVTDGHRLFVPITHSTYNTYSRAIMNQVYMEALAYGFGKSEDYNIIQNIGPDASQTIDHFHIHYVPRRPNDGLILPWTNQHSQKKPAV